MPWCSFPWHKLLPSLAQKTCFTVSLNLIHELTSLFSPKVIFAGLPGKAFPRKQAFVDISAFLWLGKQWPRFAQAQGFFLIEKLHRTTKAIAQMNADWKVEKAQYAEFNVPTCAGVDTKMWASLGSQGASSDSASSKWFDTGIVCTINTTRCPFHNHAWRPCLLNLAFLCHMPSVPKSQAFCLGPPSPYNFLCEMSPYIEIGYAHSGGAGGGGPSPKVRGFL